MFKQFNLFFSPLSTEADVFKLIDELNVIGHNSDWSKLEDIGEDLKKNKTIMMKAVTQNGFALEHASEELRGDPELQLIAK